MGRTKMKKDRRKPRLEVRSNNDFGWYDGTISLVEEDEKGSPVDPENPRVRVHFRGFEHTEDEFWGVEILRSEKEIRSRVRVLSHQLQDKECFKMVPNIMVCANYKSPDGVESKYYDGVVTKVVKAVHSKKYQDEICRCKFTIRWLEGPVKGTYVTLKCPDISLIVARDAAQHPVVKLLLGFARDHSLVTPLVSQYADGELVKYNIDESSPGPRLSTHNSPELELEESRVEEREIVSLEEELEIAEVQEQENSDDEIPATEELQDQEGLREKLEVHVLEGFREDELEITEVEVLEPRDVRQIEGGFQEQKEPEDKKRKVEEYQEKQGLRVEEELKEIEEEEEEVRWARRVKVIELDWEEELALEGLMDEEDSHYRHCDDQLLDLPPDIEIFLRNTFQVVQDALREGTMKLEKIQNSLKKS